MRRAYMLLLLFIALLLLWVAPVMECNQGRCPTTESGACDPHFTVCGTYKRLGICRTVTKPNGSFACHCEPL